MKFGIHYINLEHEKERNEQTQKMLSKFDEPCNRFPGIYGKDISDNDTISELGKILCSPKMIGCGLSHIELAKKLLDSENDFELIFEDDIVITDISGESLSKYVISEVSKISEPWDIIKFHNIGIKGLCGSTAAYALSKSGIKKLAKQKLHFHIDIIINNGYDLFVVENDIFTTQDQTNMYSNTLFDLELFGQKMGWYFNQDFIGQKLKFGNTCIMMLFILLLCIIYKTPEIFNATLIIAFSFLVYMFKLCNIMKIPKTYNMGIIQYVTFVFAYVIIQLSGNANHVSHITVSEYVLYFTIFILLIHLLHKHSA
jgi:hypothetical protein